MVASRQPNRIGKRPKGLIRWLGSSLNAEERTPRASKAWGRGKSADVKSADRVLAGLAASQAETQFLVRRAVGNEATHATGQIGDLITGVVGVRRPQAPVENGVDTAKYSLYFTKPTETDVTLVA